MSFDLIGEIGVNHNGDISMAKELISFLAEAGANFAKLQVFDPTMLVSKSAGLARYQLRSGTSARSQFEMLNSLAISQDVILELDDYASKVGVKLLGTPFDTASLNFLEKELRHACVKISSGDLTFTRLIWEASKSSMHMFISTGMSTMQEIELAIMVSRFGRAQRYGKIPRELVPSTSNLEAFKNEIAGLSGGELGVTLLHCTSSYPAPLADLNISALREMDKFGTPLGYSDHSLGELGAVLAFASGARVFEKHVTISRKLPGPDHRASLEPKQFLKYKKALMDAEIAFGNGSKVPQPSESELRKLARRGLYASRDIRVGEVLTGVNTLELRPEKGLKASNYFDLLGRELGQNLDRGDAIE